METPEKSKDHSSNMVRRAVLIGNGSPGFENQCIGLVRALGLADNLTLYRVMRPRGGINDWIWLRLLPISLHRFIDQLLGWFSRITRFLPNVQERKQSYHVPNGGFAGMSSVPEVDIEKIVAVARDTFKKEGPTLVVACGSETIPYSSLIRHLASDYVFVVQLDMVLKIPFFGIQIQHPIYRPEMFDLVVTPRHNYCGLTDNEHKGVPADPLGGQPHGQQHETNVVLTVGALHRADSAALRLACVAWRDELGALPKPLLIVNIGGTATNCEYGVDLARQLASSLYNVLDSCGSVRISFSRRTPQKVADIILEEFTGHPKVYIWDDEEPNPHMGHLWWGDAFVITADSISMLSEACSTRKPVYVMGAEHCKSHFSVFYKTLLERGAVRPFTGLENISNSWSYPPLNDAIEVATCIRGAIAKRGWTMG